MAAQSPPREPHDYQIEDYEEFLHTYRYNLANIIEVKHAIPWLMHNGVLDKQDEETILKVYTTSVLRAGDLIDTVSRRGPRAFNALMEFIEYEYPDIFQKMMDQPPRDPNPKDYIPARKKQSHLSEVINSGIELIMQAFDGSRTARNQAQASIKDLEEKIQDVECQLEMKREQILEMSQKVIELNTHNKELQTQLNDVKEERDKAYRKQKEICQERDKFRCELQEQKEKLVKGLLHHVKSVNNTTDPSMTQVDISDEDGPRLLTEVDEVQKLKNTISKLENEMKELTSDKRCLEEQLHQLADEYDMFKSSVLDQVKSLAAERDQAQHQLEELQVKYEKLQEQNNSLKVNLLSHQSTLRIFKTESSIRRTQSSMKSSSYKKEKDHETGDKCSCKAEDQASNIHHNTNRDGTNDRTLDNTLLRRVRGSEASKARETRLKEALLGSLPVAASACVTSETRFLNTGPTFRTVRKHQGEKKHALVLFAPDPLQSDLHRHLLSEHSHCFSTCPYEVLCDKHLEILPKWLDAGRCIDYRDLGEGKYYCLGSDILDILLHSDTYGHVLLDVPVEAIPRMMQQNISTFVLIIKYQHLEIDTKKTKDEQEIEKICEEYGCHYEKLIIDQNSSIGSVASIIAHKYAT